MIVIFGPGVNLKRVGWRSRRPRLEVVPSIGRDRFVRGIEDRQRVQRSRQLGDRRPRRILAGLPLRGVVGERCLRDLDDGLQVRVHALMKGLRKEHVNADAEPIGAPVNTLSAHSVSRAPTVLNIVWLRAQRVSCATPGANQFQLVVVIHFPPQPLHVDFDEVRHRVVVVVPDVFR